MLEEWKVLLEKAKKLNEEATSPPWSWFGNTKSRNLYLATVDRGRQFIMQFARWGMSSGQPLFQVPNKGDGGTMVKASDLVTFEADHRKDVSDIDHPDARMMTEGRNLFSELVAALSEAVRLLESNPDLKAEKKDAPEYNDCLRIEVRAYMPGKNTPIWRDFAALVPEALKQTRAPAQDMARGLLTGRLLDGVAGVIASVQYQPETP